MYLCHVHQHSFPIITTPDSSSEAAAKEQERAQADHAPAKIPPLVTILLHDPLVLIAILHGLVVEREHDLLTTAGGKTSPHFAARSRRGGTGRCGGRVEGRGGEHLRRFVGEVHWVHRGAVELVEVQARDVVVGIDEVFVALNNMLVSARLIL